MPERAKNDSGASLENLVVAVDPQPGDAGACRAQGVGHIGRGPAAENTAVLGTMLGHALVAVTGSDPGVASAKSGKEATAGKNGERSTRAVAGVEVRTAKSEVIKKAGF